MKKFLAAVVAIMMLLSVACAFAESTDDSSAKMYIVVGTCDAQGENAVALTEDQLAQFQFIFAIIDDSNCMFALNAEATTEEAAASVSVAANATYTVKDNGDGTSTYTITNQDGTTVDLAYSADADAFVYTDGTNCLLFANIDALEDTTDESAAQ